MYKYKLESFYDIIPLEIEIVNVELDDNGFADILSINLEYTHKLNRAKNKINNVNNIKWDEVKKVTNPYEYIYSYNSTKFQSQIQSQSQNHDVYSNNSVSLIKCLSRSFYKMIEIIHEFCPNIKNKDINQLITVHIAEGPGGFIEAVRYIRKGFIDDYAFGMTLVKYGNEYNYKHIHVPGWNQSNIFLNTHPEVYIINGKDGTGNIYNTENITFLNNEIIKIVGKTNVKTRDTRDTKVMPDLDPDLDPEPNPDLDPEPELDPEPNADPEPNEIYNNYSSVADLVTADGGIDYSIDYNYQEQSSCKLIFSQIIGAFKCQKKNGTFVCKFFDINAYFTVEMLYLLYCHYDSITIYKPFTSRIANSEKYIICSNYKGINELFLDNLIKVLYNWNSYSNKTINHMFSKIPMSFIDKIKELNKNIIDEQITSINYALNIIKTNKTINDKIWYNANIKSQIQKAKEWCKKYDIPFRNN